MRKIKIQSILAAVAGLFLATSCSSSFLDTDPTDAVSSDKVSVPENAEALVNGAWYNLFDYSSTYANIGYRIFRMYTHSYRMNLTNVRCMKQVCTVLPVLGRALAMRRSGQMTKRKN